MPWESLIYTKDNSVISEDIVLILTDTTRKSRAGMPVCSHMSWAIYDALVFLTSERAGAWIGDLYPYKREALEKIYEIPSRVDTLFAVSGGTPYRCGSRWAEFYPFLDSAAVTWLENLDGSMNVDELCMISGTERGELAEFLLFLSKVDAVRFSPERLDENIRVCPENLGKIKGLLYFFIGE
ncbi:hypothetical protein JW890_00710 [candidate division WOR-3 bacterium]|nr:hypothetical protein [candidate division WOR-3 bacterium]